MSFQGLGFTIAVGIGLAAAIFYFISQAAGESAYSNKSNNNNNKPPASEHVPYNNTWQAGRRNTKPKRKRSIQIKMTDCVICYEELNSGTTILECKHEFHSDCISHWLEESSICPLCRKTVMS